MLRRVVSQQIVGAGRPHDAIEHRRDVPGADRGQASGFFCQRAQAVLRKPHLLDEPVRVKTPPGIGGGIQLDFLG